MKKWLLGILAVSLILTGCSGGSSSPVSSGGSSSPVSSGGVTQGVVVDPYVVGAVFAEVGATGEVIQSSEPSDTQGVFVFSKPLTEGSIVKLVRPGMHMGSLFQTELKRKVDQSTGTLVVSPLTTLVVNAGSEQAARELLTQAGLTPPADFTSNPMTDVAEKTPAELTDADLAAVVANIAVGAALEVVGQEVTANDQKFRTLVEDVAQTVKDSFASSSAIKERINAPNGSSVSVDFLLAGAVSVANFAVSEEKEGDGFDSMDQDALVAGADALLTSVAANGGQAAEVQIDGGGVTTTPPNDLAANLTAGHVALQAYMLSGQTDDLLDAVKNFKTASVQADVNATQAQKDEANFFGGLALALSSMRPYSDLVDDGLNDLGDILDAFGFADNSSRGVTDMIRYPQTCKPVVVGTPPYSYQECTSDPLPPSAPTTGELQQFLYAQVQNDLSQAIAAFEKVSSGFNYSLTDGADGSTVEIDFSDAKFFRALALTLLGQINFQQAYNFNVDLYQQEQTQLAPGNYTTEDALTDNPELGTLKQNAQKALDDSKNYFSQAADGFLAAIAAVEAESDSGPEQQDDLISLNQETCSWDTVNYVYACVYDPDKTARDIQQAKDGLRSFKTSLSGMTTFSASSPNEFQLDLSPLFAGLDLRSQLPTFNGNNPSLFPDPTFGGILGNGTPELNTDLDGDGMPDLLMGYTQFSDSIFPAAPLYGYFSYSDQAGQNLDGRLTMNPNRTFTIESFPTQVSGQWSIEAGTLKLKVTGGALYTATINHGDGGNGYLNFDAQVTDPTSTGSGWMSIY